MLTKTQEEAIQKPCPHCEIGKLRAVDSVEEEGDEVYLWCDSCLLSMDGDGGYTY